MPIIKCEEDLLRKRNRYSCTQTESRGHSRADPVSEQSAHMTETINTELGSEYSLPGPQLTSQPVSITAHWLVPIILPGDRGMCM